LTAATAAARDEKQPAQQALHLNQALAPVQSAQEAIETIATSAPARARTWSKLFSAGR